MIFYRQQHAAAINFAVFPSLQGGPHEHQIAAVATQLKLVGSPAFKAYATQVVDNTRALAARLVKHGYTLISGGSDNHLLLWDLRPEGLTGSKLEHVTNLCHITLNKNTVIGDKSALSPGGVRLGTPALTTRGMKEADFEKVADMLHEVVQFCLRLQEKTGKPIRAFKEGTNDEAFLAEVNAIKAKVHEFATGFPMPGDGVGNSN
jgi:glycine hydroxymethyltransferase